MSFEAIAISLRDARVRAVQASERDRPPALLRADWACLLLLALAGAAISLWGFAQFDDRIYAPEGFNLWFQADQPRSFANLTLRNPEIHWLQHYRTAVHPIFSLLLFPPCRALMALGMAPLAAAKLLVVGSAALTAALFHLGLRGLGLGVLAAFAFTAALLGSATFIHWFSIIDCYAFTALSITLMLAVLAWWRRPGDLPWILGSAATLAVTVTNWSFGLAAAFFRLPFRRFLRVSAAALLLVAALAAVQKLVFPTAALFFVPGNLLREQEFTQVQEQARGTGEWTPLANLRSMLLHSAGTPPARLEDVLEAGKSFLIVSNQNVRLAEHRPAGAVATLLWAGLLGLGLWGAATAGRRDAALALGAFCAGQVALHLVYGQITFLYAANFFPAFLALAAFGALTRIGTVAVMGALAFAVVGGYSNAREFLDAVALANSVLAAR